MTRFTSRPNGRTHGRRPLSTTVVLVLAAAIAIAGVLATPLPQDDESTPSAADDGEWASTAVSTTAWSTDEAWSSTSSATSSASAAAKTSSAQSDEKSSWATWDHLKYLLFIIPVLVVAIILTKIRNCICGKPPPKHNIPMGYAGGTSYGGYAHEQQYYQQQQDWEWQQQQLQQQQQQQWEWEQQQQQQQRQHDNW